MVQVRKSVRPVEEPVARKGAPPSGRTRAEKALELVAMRGRDVIGVRHILLGGTAWVGDVRAALARIPMREFGGQPLIIGAVTQDEYALYVPPRARARMHGAGGVPRLLMGPYKVTLTPGERAVLVLGPIQIRAQIVSVDSFAGRGGLSSGGMAGWIACATAIYVTSLTVCAALAPPIPQHLDPGAMQRLHGHFLPKVASR